MQDMATISAEDYPTYGAYLRAKNLHISNSQTQVQVKRDNTELNAYREARRQGIQPDGTSMRAIDKAVRMSDKYGKPYGAI
jgi:hypothetical protein